MNQAKSEDLVQQIQDGKNEVDGASDREYYMRIKCSQRCWQSWVPCGYHLGDLWTRPGMVDAPATAMEGAA